MARDFVDLNPGETLEPYHINMIYAELRRWRKIRGGTGVRLSGTTDQDSVPEISVLFPKVGFVGVANGDITARVGSTPGTGTVTVKQLDTDDELIDAQVTDIEVYNASVNTMTSGQGIDDGQYVWVQRDGFGRWWVAPLECS